ncbi:MAG: sulfotransferase domain-containing protein [Candidatus Hermodarchaeia archaeon]|jgi:hypothetical protein
MLKQIELENEPLGPRIFVNGFPKSGTHLALLTVLAMAKPQKRSDGGDLGYWFGTFRNNAWSDIWLPTARSLAIIRGQPRGTWMKGHCGFQNETNAAFQEMGTCMVFIYRDPRDVAVSLSYHIESDKERYSHSERELFMSLPTHEERLLAILHGFGSDPGLIPRWKLYAPWLDQDWVCAIKFEDVIADKRGAVEKVLQYIIKRTANHNGLMPVVIKANYDLMVEKALSYMAQPKEYSSTFRKGTAGQWMEEFTPRVMEAFEVTGGSKWIKKLGYKEKDNVRSYAIL